MLHFLILFDIFLINDRFLAEDSRKLHFTQHLLNILYLWGLFGKDDVKINDGLCYQGVHNRTSALLVPKISLFSHVIERKLKKIGKVKNFGRKHEQLSKVFSKKHLSILPTGKLRIYTPLNVLVVKIIVRPHLFPLPQQLVCLFFIVLATSTI